MAKTVSIYIEIETKKTKLKQFLTALGILSQML